MRTILIVAVLLAIVGLASHAAASNTVSFGVDKAYLYSNGVLKIPINVNNETALSGIGWGIVVTSTGQPVIADSISPEGRLPRKPSVDGLFSENGMSTVDSICFFIATPPNPLRCILPGSGTAGAAWFTGAALGDHLHIAAVDSSFGGCSFDSAHLFDCTIPPVAVLGDFLPTDLVVVPALVEMAAPDTGSGQSGFPITFDVQLSGFGSTFSLELASLTGPRGPISGPVISGSNPFVVNWTPAIDQYGEFSLVLRGSDTFGQTVEKSIAISVAKSTIQGDNNCDNVVDLTDLARLVAFLTGTGAAPICPGK